MFGRKKYTRLDSEVLPVEHLGIFRRKIGLWEAVALIVSTTIGAGVLSLPYAVARVGIWIGLIYIIVLGFLMMGLNLLVGELSAKTRTKLQLVGLANKYLGRPGEWLMTVLVYVMGMGVLVVYIIGIGETLATLFGGINMIWSLAFALIGGLLIFIGMRSIKVVGFVLSLGILVVVLVIAIVSVPHMEIPHFSHFNMAYLLFPYGVVLFAFRGSSAIPEAHSILIRRDKDFKKAIVIAGIITTVVYALFALVVVGVTGLETTEIATIGLGNTIGRSVFVFGNLFALLAMGTSFLMVGLSLRDSMSWDYKIPGFLSGLVVVIVPTLLFVLGLRHFIAVIDIVGGVFVSLELLLILFIYWRAKTVGHLPSGKFKLHHSLLLVAVLLVAFLAGAIYSVVKLF